MKRACRYLAIIITLGANQAPLADPPAVLILPFDNSTGNPDLDTMGTGTADILTACLSAYPDQLAVLDRSIIEARSAELSLDLEGYTDTESIKRLAPLTAADYILRGTFRRVDGGLLIQALLFDASTTQLLGSAEGHANAGGLYAGICDDVAVSIINFLHTERGHRQVLPVAINPERQQLLIEGLGYYYNGRYSKALSTFLQLIDDDPNDANAHYWLGKSFQAAGEKDLAKHQFRIFLSRFPDDDKALSVNELLSHSDLTEP